MSNRLARTGGNAGGLDDPSPQWADLPGDPDHVAYRKLAEAAGIMPVRGYDGPTHEQDAPAEFEPYDHCARNFPSWIPEPSPTFVGAAAYLTSLDDEPMVTMPVRLFDTYFDADDSHDPERMSEAKYALYCAAYHMCPDCAEHDGNHSEHCMTGSK